MKIITLVSLVASLSITSTALAENLNHLSQLLSTGECPSCDLQRSGLVMANLSGANLRGADLSHANLSQANLSGADLSGANLSGTSLYGANLTGANLSGANLTSTDLRNSYLVNADLTGVNLSSAYVQGAQGLPNYAGTPELFYRWGTAEAQRGNYKGAITNYNSALAINPEFASAYLGRALSNYRLGNKEEANKDAQMASQLYEQQKNPNGQQIAQQFLQAMEIASKPPEEPGTDPDLGGDLGNVLMGIGSMVMQFLMF